MKSIAVVFLVLAILTLGTVSTAVASHGVKTTSAPVPAHGSVWHGTGLDRYRPTQLPAHGSIWFGSGLSQL